MLTRQSLSTDAFLLLTPEPPKRACLRATHNNLDFYCWTIFALTKVLVRLSSSGVESPLQWQINVSSE